VGAALLLTVALHGQQQAPTFTGANRTVAVFATVTDANGRLVPDLTRDQFHIEDNGARQELTLFGNDIQPITVVMLLDRSTSMRRNFELVEKAAEEFVNVMLPADKARIGSFSDRIQVDPRDFTSDHDELLRILRVELQFEGPTPLWNAVNVGITALLHQQGRRVILVFTDGMDSPMNFSNNNSSLKDVMKRAEEENVMVYAIGFAGSSGPHSGGYGGGYGGPPVGGHPGGGGGHGRGGFGGGGRGGYRGGGYGGGRPMQADKPDEGLPKIASATGGGYFELTSTDDLASTFTRVAEELHHQYALGFTPTKLDGKMHSLALKLSQTGLTARARKSYLATAPRS
jgi:VWFA-related protein